MGPDDKIEMTVSLRATKKAKKEESSKRALIRLGSSKTHLPLEERVVGVCGRGVH